MKYYAFKKIGLRQREWHIVNELGGLVEEFTGTKKQALDRAAKVERQRKAALAQNSQRIVSNEN